MRRTGGLWMSGAALAVSACVPSREAPPPAAPPPPTRPAPVPAPPPPPPADWRDAPLTPGTWTLEQGGTAASYGAHFQLRCDAAARRVALVRSGAAAGTMVIRTTYGARSLTMAAGGQAALPANDPLLDQIAFSRGRFTVEIAGMPTLTLPSWAEPARVIEECRG